MRNGKNGQGTYQQPTRDCGGGCQHESGGHGDNTCWCVFECGGGREHQFEKNSSREEDGVRPTFHCATFKHSQKHRREHSVVGHHVDFAGIPGIEQWVQSAGREEDRYTGPSRGCGGWGNAWNAKTQSNTKTSRIVCCWVASFTSVILDKATCQCHGGEQVQVDGTQHLIIDVGVGPTSWGVGGNTLCSISKICSSLFDLGHGETQDIPLLLHIDISLCRHLVILVICWGGL